MITPKKISQFLELNVDVMNPPSYTYFPIIYRDSNGTINNGKTNLTNLINGLKNVVTTIALQAISTGEYELPESGGGGSSSSDYTLLNNKIEEVKFQVQSLLQSSNYPIHKIIINNGSEDVATYNLPTGPGSSSQTIKIVSNLAARPMYLVELTISTINVTGTSLSVGINVIASTLGTYNGGTLTTVLASGSFSGGGTSGNLSNLTLLNLATSITNNNSAELYGTLNGTVPSGTTLLQVTVSLLVTSTAGKITPLTAMASKYGSTTNTGKASTLIT